MEVVVAVAFAGVAFLTGMVVGESINRAKVKEIVRLNEEAYGTFQAVTEAMKKRLEKQDQYIRALEVNLKIREGVRNDGQGTFKGN